MDCLDIARKGAVTAKRFARARFCADLKINVAMLPLLASAIGNDYVAGRCSSAASRYCDRVAATL